MNRFLRSRILPVLTILILFSGWIGIAGLLLWQVKVKEEFPSLGKIVSSGERINQAIQEQMASKGKKENGQVESRI